MSNQATAKGERNDLGGKAGRNNRPSAPQERRQAPPSPPADKSQQPPSPQAAPSIAASNPVRPTRPVNGAGPAHASSVPGVVPPPRTHSAPPNLTMPPHLPIYFPEKGPVPAAHGKQYPYYPPSGAFPPGMPYYMPPGGPLPHVPQYSQAGPPSPMQPMGLPGPSGSRPSPQQQPPITAPSPAAVLPPSAPGMKATPGVPAPPATSAVLTPPPIVGIQPGAFQRAPTYQPPAMAPAPPAAKKASRAIQIIDPTTGQPLVLGGKPAAAAPAAAAPAAPVHKSSAITIERPTPEMLAAHQHRTEHHHPPAAANAAPTTTAPAATPSATFTPSASTSIPSVTSGRSSSSGTKTEPATLAAPTPSSDAAPSTATVSSAAVTAPKEDKAAEPAPAAPKEATPPAATTPAPAAATPQPAAPAPVSTETPAADKAPEKPAEAAEKSEKAAAAPALTLADASSQPPAEKVAAPAPQESEKDVEAKKSRKEILKQADRGDYKARTFDAYATPPEKPTEAPKSKEAARATPPPASERRSPQPGTAQEEEDSWEAKDVNTLVKSIPKPDTSASKLGKIMYERDFLLRFKDVCTECPPNFPPFASIIGDVPSRSGGDRDRGRGGGDEKWERGKPVAPLRSGAGRGGPPPGLGASGRGGARGGDRGGVRESIQRRPIVKKGAKAPPVLEKVAPLVVSSNRWVRPSSKESDATAVTLRKTQGLLNKLTLENFDSVSDQVIANITTLELLSGMITLVFDKALSEPHFCPMYAELCLKMSAKTPADFSKGEHTGPEQSKKSPFTRILLTKCQDEFEKSSKPEEVPVNLSPLEKDELESKHRRRVLGNIKFIGELFKLGMLTEKIMHDCITRLLGNVKNPVLEDIEALSKLMTTIGERIDHPKAAKYMDAYFARIAELSQNKKLPSRLRFMLKDLIDLRAHRWVARRKVEGPKAHTTQSLDKDDDEPTPPPRAAPAPSRGGRVTIAPRGSLDKDFRSDRDRSDRDHRGGRTPAAAPAGAGRGAAPPPQRSANANAFSLLGREQEERYTSGGKRDQELSLGPGGQAHTAIGASGAKGWAKPDAAQKAAAKPAAATPTAAASAPAPVPAAPAAERVAPAKMEEDSAVHEADRERLEGEVVSILEEYLSSKEEGEAVECVKELNAVWYHADLVCQLVVAAMERKDEADRDATRRLLSKLHEAKVLTTDELERGFGKVADVLPDIVLDSPRCVEFFAAFIADALHDRCITAKIFAQLASREELVNDGTAKTLLGETMLALTDMCELPEKELPTLLPNVDYCAFFKPKERTARQLMTWLKEKELLTLFPFAPAARLVDEHFEKSGSNPADLETWLQDAVEAEAFEEQPEGALSLLRHVVRRVLAHAFPAPEASSSAANDASRVTPYNSLLNKLASVNPQGGAALLGAARDFAARADSPVAILSQALRVIVTGKVVSPAALKKWGSEEKDKALIAQLGNESWWAH